MTIHHYHCAAEWTGAATGPTDVSHFNRNIRVDFAGHPSLEMSAPAAFQGSAERVNPEELFVASLVSCQMLTYLALAARHGVDVLAYHDEADGEMMLSDGHMRITKVTLHPAITITAQSDFDEASRLIELAHRDCFIDNSITSTLVIEPQRINVQNT